MLAEVNNLCVNARDAITGVGKIIVETGNATFDEEYCDTESGVILGEYVRISVRDTGVGMDKQTLTHIFEPFFTTKGIGVGTGLGLATVYGIVKQNNGFINVNSEPEQGTTFNIYLPRHRGEPLPKNAESKIEPAMGGNEIILLVEDEPEVLDMIKLMLEQLGYTVLTARSPGEAIQIEKDYTGRIDLLVTDFILPEMDGRVLATLLLKTRSRMKVLFVSGYAENAVTNPELQDDSVYFLEKPFSQKKLAARVREALS